MHFINVRTYILYTGNGQQLRRRAGLVQDAKCVTLVYQYFYIHDRIYSISLGISQGTVLGPLLFNIFASNIVNDIEINCLLDVEDLKLFQIIQVGFPQAFD